MSEPAGVPREEQLIGQLRAISSHCMALIDAQYPMSKAAEMIVRRIAELSCVQYAGHTEIPCRLCGSRGTVTRSSSDPFEEGQLP